MWTLHPIADADFCHGSSASSVHQPHYICRHKTIWFDTIQRDASVTVVKFWFVLSRVRALLARGTAKNQNFTTSQASHAELYRPTIDEWWRKCVNACLTFQSQEMENIVHVLSENDVWQCALQHIRALLSITVKFMCSIHMTLPLTFILY